MKKLIALLLTVTLCFAGCSTPKNKGEVNSSEKKKITIAYQYGIGYAPIVVMKQKQLIEKYYDNVQVEYQVLSSGAAINDGIIAGEIDVAVMGIAPFLIGWDKGVPYKLYSAIAQLPMELVTYDKTITSLSDFKPGDKIAVPSYGSIQHIILAMAAEEQLGDSHAMDDYIINMSFPDGVQALSTQKEVKGIMATPPYCFQLLEQEEYSSVFKAQDAVNTKYTHLVGAVGTEFQKTEPELYNAIVKATTEAMDFIKNNPAETGAILSETEGIEAEKLEQYLQDENCVYNTDVVGISKIADFMQRAEYIKKSPVSIGEIAFDNVKEQ